MNERHPQLCEPLFSSALPHLLRHSQYPASFTTWEEDELDEDEFYRQVVRGQSVLSVLIRHGQHQGSFVTHLAPPHISFPTPYTACHPLFSPLQSSDESRLTTCPYPPPPP